LIRFFEDEQQSTSLRIWPPQQRYQDPCMIELSP